MVHRYVVTINEHECHIDTPHVSRWNVSVVRQSLMDGGELWKVYDADNLSSILHLMVTELARQITRKDA